MDPKKLSAGAAGAGSGLLGGPGGATRADAPAPGTSAKWQVSVRICLKSAAGCLSELSAVVAADSIQAKPCPGGLAEGLTSVLGSMDCHSVCCCTSGCSCCAVTLLAHRLQEVLWQRLGKSFEQLHWSAVTVWHLQRVLVKKRDPLTHVCFMDAYLATGETPLPSDAAWCVRVGPAVREACSEASVRIPWAQEPPH